MKKLFTTLLLIALTVLAVTTTNLPRAEASVPSGTAVLYLYKNGYVDNATWVTLIATTARAIQGVAYSNSSPESVYLGTVVSSAAAQSETPVAIINSGATLFLPIQISGSQRVSIKSVGGTNTGGRLEASFLYF